MPQPVILHVEDDSDDAFFVAHAFESGFPEGLIHRVQDGREAIDHLEGTAQVASSDGQPKVDLVLLDLKLPDIDGFEVLQWIRSQPRFNILQVVVLSGSSLARDKERASELGANAYFVKTPRYADVVAFVRRTLQDKTRSKTSSAEGQGPDDSIGSIGPQPSL